MSFSYDVPTNTKSGLYVLQFMVYDENDDIFQNSNDDEASFTKTIKIEGNCQGEITPGTVTISAVLDPLDQEIKVGKEVSIKATLTNTGTEKATYQVSLTSYEDWATLSGIAPTNISVEAGQTGSISILLTPKTGSEGTQDATIQVFSNGEIVTQKVIEIIIPGAAGALTGFAIADSFRQNWFIWTIAGINILLVLIIIIIAARIARKSSD